MTLVQGGGRICSSKKHSGSCSSRVKVLDDANVADVDQINIEEDDISNSDDPIADPNEDADAGIFSIANDYISEDENTLTEEEDDLLAVRTRRTATNQSHSAEDFLQAREQVVRFVQDSTANAVDRQKRNADKHGSAKVLLFNVGDLVLLSMVNLPKHVVANVGTSKLLPKYIGSFRLLRRKCNAYTIEFLAGCVRILRFMSFVSARTISTRSLPRANTTATFKIFHEILVGPSQLLNLDP